MTLEIVIVLVVACSGVVLFATERLPVDLTAMILMGTMLLSGIISPLEAIGGFSNPATVTVGAMFVLSAGLFKTGAVNALGGVLVRLGKINSWLLLATLMLVVGAVSAFINNTAAVAILMPVVLGISRETGIAAGRLLVPLSFASMFGGTCTLVGTSTNILVSAVAQGHGLAPLGMFEMTELGLIFFGVGAAYLLLVGVRLIPDRPGEAGRDPLYGSGDYQIEIVVGPRARSVGRVLAESPLLKDVKIREAVVFRDGERLGAPPEELVLRAGDHLKVRCDLQGFLKLRGRRGITMRQESAAGASEEVSLVEAVVAPGSALDGQSLTEARFVSRFGLTALALRHRDEIKRQDLETVQLSGGDVLLFEVDRQGLDRLREDSPFVLVSQVQTPTFRKRRIFAGVAIVAAVVFAASAGLVPIVAGSIAGCILMVLTRCLTLEEAYAAINWHIIFLLAGVLTLGTALENTGAANLLGGYLVGASGVFGPVVLLSALYLGTSLLTEVMSNNATAALLAPVAIAAAEVMGVSPRPFLMAITFAASASFMTPVGYQTNTLIYGPSRLRYADFLRVGTPLNLLFWIVATLFIPRIWPF